MMGEAPYVTVEEQEVVLPAVASGRFFVNFKSNLMEEPAIALELTGEKRVRNTLRHSRGIDVQLRMKTASWNWRCSQTFWIRNGGTFYVL